jgi:Spy/CpxP family protein refolding chaperone
MKTRTGMLLLTAALAVAPLTASAQPAPPPRPVDLEDVEPGSDLFDVTDEHLALADDLLAQGLMAPEMGGRHARRMRHVLHGRAGAWSQLDLSDAQREKLSQIREAQQRKAIQARADMKLAGLDLHKLMRAEKPNLAAINSQIDKISSMRASLRKSQVAAMLEARNLLTPEQQKQLRESRFSSRRGGRGELGD